MLLEQLTMAAEKQHGAQDCEGIVGAATIWMRLVNAGEDRLENAEFGAERFRDNPLGRRKAKVGGCGDAQLREVCLAQWPNRAAAFRGENIQRVA